MNIDQNFIHHMVYSFYESVMQDGDLCNYSTSSPTNGNYDNKVYQKIYALKYFPAYYFEYCVLASLLAQRLTSRNISNINVASFGCGLYPDYFALAHNLNNVNFSYYGYDICHWKTRELLPKPGQNICLTTTSIDNIAQNTLNNIDVFIFPKSLGDIAENANISLFSSNLAKSNKNTLFFLNSFITFNHKLNNHHVEIFSTFHNALLSNGYTTSDASNKTYYRGAHEHQGLKGIDYRFDYPEDIQLCDEDCADNDSCRIIRKPVLTNSYMNYQILEYTR